MQRVRTLLVSCLLVLTACSGAIGPEGERSGGTASSARPDGGKEPANGTPGQPGPPGPSPVAPGEPRGPAEFSCSTAVKTPPPPRRLWRLTKKQYAQTIAVLLGLPATSPAIETPLEPLGDEHRFKSLSGDHSLTNFEFTQSVTTTESTARKLVESLRTGSCWGTATGTALDVCIDTVIRDRGAILFRRPLTPDELTRYGRLAKNNLATFGKDEALSLAFQAMLMAPQFLFLSEIGAPVAGTPGVSRLTAYEVASALSYVLTDSPPDAMLWEAAKKDALSTPEQIAAQVARLAPAAVGLREFVAEYFHIDKVLHVAKSIEKSCEYGRDRILTDARLLIDDVVKGSLRKDFLKTLLTTSTGYAGCDSYKLYGLSSDPKKDAPQMLNPAQRSGLLTHPAFLAGFAAFEETLPVKRGKFINETILCRPIPEVPLDVVAKLPTSQSTMREKLALHNKEARCNGCHQMLDPMGLAFESYDAYGRYRTTQYNKPLDPSGTLTGTVDADGPFKDAVELTRKLAGSVTVEQCFLRHGFRYFMGRAEDAFDSCTLETAARAYRTSSGDFVAALSAIFTSPSFLNRSHP